MQLGRAICLSFMSVCECVQWGEKKSYIAETNWRHFDPNARKQEKEKKMGFVLSCVMFPIEYSIRISSTGLMCTCVGMSSTSTFEAQMKNLYRK
jgi:hypothetical protein